MELFESCAVKMSAVINIINNAMRNVEFASPKGQTLALRFTFMQLNI